MTRRTSTFSQTDVARAIRVAMKEGASAVEVRRDGTIVVLINAPPPTAPEPTSDPFTDWERAYEARKASARPSDVK